MKLHTLTHIRQSQVNYASVTHTEQTLPLVMSQFDSDYGFRPMRYPQYYT